MIGIFIIFASVGAFILFAMFGMIRYTREFWHERDWMGLTVAGSFWLLPIGAALALFGI